MTLKQSTQTLVMLLLVGIVSMGVVSMGLYVFDQQIQKEQLESSLKLVSKIGADNISKWFDERKINMDSIANHPTILNSVKIISNPQSSPDKIFKNKLELTKTVSHMFDSWSWFEGLRVSDPNTGELIYKFKNMSIENLKQKQHYIDALNGKIGISDIHPSKVVLINEFGEPEKGVPTQLMSFPLYGDVGLEGIITVRINIFEINSSVSNYVSQYTSGNAYVVDSTGLIISHPSDLHDTESVSHLRPELVLHSINPLDNKFTELYQSMNDDKSIVITNPYYDFRGVSVVGSISPIQNHDWFLIFEINSDEIQKNSEFKQVFMIYFVILLSMLIVIMSEIVSKKTSQPLIKLKHNAEEISKGNLSMPISVSGTFEIVQLSQSMELMRKSILKSLIMEKKLDASELSNQQKLQLFTKLSEIVKLVSNGDLSQKLVTDNNDSDEIAELKLNFNNAVKKLRAVDSDRSAFSAMITHELKTPLVPIKGYSQMLLKEKLGKLTDDQKDAINEILIASDLLYTLIQNILSAQKTDSGQDTLNITAISSSKILNDIFKKMSPIMQDKQIEFKQFPLSETLILVDYGKIIEVLTNLIQNAVDFVPKKSGEIEISCTKDDDGALFSVKDNGIGMSLDQQKKLFTKFYQVDTSATRKHGGSGLGLSICKGLVEIMGGKIWVKSEPSHGSTFYFTLPSDNSNKFLLNSR